MLPPSAYRNQPYPLQLLRVVVFIALVTGACLLLPESLSYRVAALILLMAVSLTALLLDVLPVMVAALLSALSWNFFFIPPRFTFRISSTEDSLMFVMYFVVALVHAVLTLRIRRREKIDQAREEHNKSLKLYSTLLNSLSHELRTPIATIIGASDTLLNESRHIAEANRTALVQEISTASLRLNQQVNNLLNMSRIESGFITPKTNWCDVNELVYGVIHRLEENPVSRLIRVQVPEDFPLVKLDAGLMEEVLYNLLGNAVQHTPAGTPIMITARTANGDLVLTVEDEGPGFPADELRQVFGKFYRLKRSAPGGTGLGLSIVKGFVEAHQGIITLTNRPEGGARFVIRIPTTTAAINSLKND